MGIETMPSAEELADQNAAKKRMDAVQEEAIETDKRVDGSRGDIMDEATEEYNQRMGRIDDIEKARTEVSKENPLREKATTVRGMGFEDIAIAKEKEAVVAGNEEGELYDERKQNTRKFLKQNFDWLSDIDSMGLVYERNIETGFSEWAKVDKEELWRAIAELNNGKVDSDKQRVFIPSKTDKEAFYRVSCDNPYAIIHIFVGRYDSTEKYRFTKEQTEIIESLKPEEE